MVVNKNQLSNLGVSDSDASKYMADLNVLLEQHHINTPLRIAHFLAQVLHESTRMSRVEENLNYSASGLLKVFKKYFTADQAQQCARQPVKIANRVYANRLGNGDANSGEGFCYRGRGLIQLTGKSNYQQFSDWVSDDVVGHPDLVADRYAVHSAVYFWTSRNLSSLADADDVEAVTQRINGGLNGLEDRRHFLERAKDEFQGFPAPDTSEATPQQSLSELLRTNQTLHLNQDLINYFYRKSNNTFEGATHLASQHNIDLHALTLHRKAPITVPTTAEHPTHVVPASTPGTVPDGPRSEAVRKLIAMAKAEVGTREEGGNNRGARIEEYQQATWLTPGPWPWCAAFTAWLLQEWLEDATIRDFLILRSQEAAMQWRCQDASAFGWEKWANKRNLPLLPETELARAGDFVVFDFSHIGLVIADQQSGANFIETIEGNTNGRGERDSTSGDGVWRKRRARELTKSYIRLML